MDPRPNSLPPAVGSVKLTHMATEVEAPLQNHSDHHITISGLLLTGLWRDPLTARSRTRDRLGHIDFGMIIPPIRAFVFYMMLPSLCYPVALLHLYGFYRCLRTVALPRHYSQDRYEKHVIYGVQKRTYDRRRRTILEVQVDDVMETRRALYVTNGQRNTFVDDPAHPGTAYYIVEQKVMRAEAMFTGENWTWAFISDSCRFLLPAALAYTFVPASKRLSIDLRLWRQGRLTLRQVRHPITNFFKSYAEYNKNLHRLNVVKPTPKGAQPWSRSL